MFSFQVNCLAGDVTSNASLKHVKNYSRWDNLFPFFWYSVQENNNKCHAFIEIKTIVDYEILVTLVVKKVYKARKHAVSEAVF